MTRSKGVAKIVALLATMIDCSVAQAGERGLTNYLAGYYGDFAVAVAPKQGLYVYATAYRYDGSSEGPDIAEDFELDGLAGIAGFQYVTPWSLFGAKYAFAGYTTYIDAQLSVTGLGAVGEDRGFGDSSVSPLVLYWQFGNVHVSFYESIIVPTAAYAAAAPVNTGRNYFSFDSVLALTWLDPNIGLEVSLVPGLMINTPNMETSYQTGAEFHVDGMLNVVITPNLAVGLHGYYYAQIAGDDDPLDLNSELRGQSYAIGPAVLLVPPGLKSKIVGKWLHELDAENKFEGEILSLTVVKSF